MNWKCTIAFIFLYFSFVQPEKLIIESDAVQCVQLCVKKKTISNTHYEITATPYLWSSEYPGLQKLWLEMTP